MRIEIWSDVVCPWCYIGKRRLEQALTGFAHRDEVELVWRSFLLDPSAPATPVETVAESLGRKYGGGAAAGQQMVDRVEAVAAEEGLVFRLGEAQRVGTVDAHRVLHEAASGPGGSEQRRAELKEALLAAYFLAARNVADPDVLVELAAGVGIAEERTREVLAGDAHREAVDADLDAAVDLGASGVPFFIVDGRFGVSGAQPVETFARVLERAWAERAPLQMVSVTEAGSGSCEGDSCAV